MKTVKKISGLSTMRGEAASPTNPEKGRGGKRKKKM